MKFVIADGNIKFVYSKINDVYTYTEAQHNKIIELFNKRKTTPAITLFEQPTADILSKVQGKKFNNITDAQQFINGTLPKTDIEIMQETIDGLLIAVTGGAINV